MICRDRIRERADMSTRDNLDFVADLAPVLGDIIHMAKHPNRIKSTNKVMKQAKARSIKRSGHKVKQGKGRK